MVAATQFTWLLLAQEGQQPTTQNLPEPVRYVAYMALLGIALLGMLLVVGILLGGHWVRRLGDRVRRSSLPEDVIIHRPETRDAPNVPPEQPNDGDTWASDETIA